VQSLDSVGKQNCKKEHGIGNGKCPRFFFLTLYAHKIKIIKINFRFSVIRG